MIDCLDFYSRHRFWMKPGMEVSTGTVGTPSRSAVARILPLRGKIRAETGEAYFTWVCTGMEEISKSREEV